MKSKPSYRLSYLKLEIGAGNRVRTGDLNLGKVALYQLSYSRFEIQLLNELFQMLSMQ